MNSTITSALESITDANNLSMGGLTHPNDMNRAIESFKILHEHGEILLKKEIVAWAMANNWKEDDADQLGSLAQQIGEGKEAKFTGGPWWNENIYETWSRPRKV